MIVQYMQHSLLNGQRDICSRHVNKRADAVDVKRVYKEGERDCEKERERKKELGLGASLQHPPFPPALKMPQN